MFIGEWSCIGKRERTAFCRKSYIKAHRRGDKLRYGKLFSSRFTRPYIGMSNRATAHNTRAAGFHVRPRALSFLRRHARGNKTPPRLDLRSTLDANRRLQRLCRRKQCVVCAESRPLYCLPIRPPTVRRIYEAGACARCLRGWISSFLREGLRDSHSEEAERGMQSFAFDSAEGYLRCD